MIPRRKIGVDTYFDRFKSSNPSLYREQVLIPKPNHGTMVSARIECAYLEVIKANPGKPAIFYAKVTNTSERFAQKLLVDFMEDDLVYFICEKWRRYWYLKD